VRYYYYSKATADEFCRLRISDLRKDGMLSWGYSSGTRMWASNSANKGTIIGIAVDISDDPYARLIYSVTDQEGKRTDYDYQVSLVTTPCNFGGERYWFACPSCGQRVAVLYRAPGDVYFRCRYCNNLSYRSRNRGASESFGHTSRQIEKLRSEIKRWTWRGRPTRKVKRLLRALERKEQMLGQQAMRRFERFKALLLRKC